jgi:hypothetical protein
MNNMDTKSYQLPQIAPYLARKHSEAIRESTRVNREFDDLNAEHGKARTEGWMELDPLPQKVAKGVESVYKMASNTC